MTASPRPRNVLILGGTSDIAHAMARCFAADAATIALVGRNLDRLERFAADLEARGAARVVTFSRDLSEVSATAYAEWDQALGGVHLVVIAYGVLGDQQEAEQALDAQERLLSTNFLSPVGWMQVAARSLAARGGGTIAVLGSVAGDRARKSNYIYGSAKAGLHFYAEGMALAAAGQGVRVVLIKPGQTRTRMTSHMETQGPLWSDAERVGTDAYRAAVNGTRTSYSPWFWRWIMRIIRSIPQPLFRRLKL